MMKQWMLKITKYADRLIKDLDTVDYLDKIKTQQVNWIGKSEGAVVKFKVKNYKVHKAEEDLEVFTTRPDTLFGCTYMVLSPEHPLIKNQESRIKNYAEVEKYIKQAKNKSDLERTDLAKGKTGVELKGIKAINPVNNEEIPIWIADYVLVSYGTGAIMAVPAHDSRDYEFAKKYRLKIFSVVRESFGSIENQEKTLNSYNENIQKYISGTPQDVSSSVKKWINNFLLLIKKDAKILELGSAFGRDADYIENLGYKVDRSDGASGFVDYQISKNKDIKVLDLLSDTISFFMYDLIFANAALLHFNKNQIGYILRKINNGLKNNGIFAFTVKKGKKRGIETHKLGAERYFNFWTSNELKKILRESNFEVVKIEEEILGKTEWIHIIAKKRSAIGAFTGDGVNINSDFLNGLKTEEAKKKITEWLEKNKLGKKAINYKLRDWVFSRQHYWGEPIPIVKCENCGNVALEEKDLPLELPEVKNYEPTETGESPLAKIKKWTDVKCPRCGGPAKRETDTMPNWAGSSWYYLAYIMQGISNFQFPISKYKEGFKHWMPVDLYNGGMEHTTLHLLYSRFWHKFLFDLGYVNTPEPYKMRRSHGTILAEDGQKMSKSRGNVINPDNIIKKYGADTLRLYEMFIGPYAEAIPWNTNSLIGMSRFLQKIWKLSKKSQIQNHKSKINPKSQIQNNKINQLLHQTIKKVTEDIESFNFNTAISQLMILTNAMEKEKKLPITNHQLLIILLSPFAPHISEELWENSGNKKSIFLEKWPKYNPKFIKEKEIELVIQINGKVRDKIKTPADISEDGAKKIAFKSEKIKKWIDEKEIRKIIFVKGKLVNIVI